MTEKTRHRLEKLEKALEQTRAALKLHEQMISTIGDMVMTLMSDSKPVSAGHAKKKGDTDG